jgi:hypothetical protein
MRILYYDCFAGISGDMNLGALLDLGIAPDHLRRELAKLPLTGYTLDIRRASRNGISGTQVSVVLDPAPLPHRHLADIEAIITGSELAAEVQQSALAVFRNLAEAEAQVHGIPVEAVHFHEVGAVDAIVDIVGAAICRQALAVDRVLCSPVELGSGRVRCAHGLLPVPAPATVALLQGKPVKHGGLPFEATTPTGAALLATWVDEFTAQTAFTLHQTGYGLGQRIAATPNVLRVFLGEQPDHDPATEMVEELCLLECNLDDLNPELYEHVMNRLFQQGALEVYWTPVVMKKSRPGVLLSVLCEPPLIANVMAVLFAETTTLGVRQQRVSRTALVREIVNVTTRYGQVRVKTAHYHQQLVNCKAEYEDCKRLAEAFAIPLKVIYAEVNRAIAAQIDGVFPADILPPP